MNEYEDINSIVTPIADATEKLGLYMVNAQMMTSGDFGEDSQIDIKNLLTSGEEVYLQCVWTIGDVAFSDRVQNPEKYDTDKLFREIAPTAADITKSSMLDKLKNGSGLDDLFDTDDDEDDADDDW